jgi:2-methylcitrate dehydratase PrpD
VIAAELAAAGGAGPRAVLEDRFGLFATHVDSDWDIAARLQDLGQRWETERVALKPYPACHWIHAPVDAVVRAADGAEPDAVERIVVRIPASGVPIVLEPEAPKRRPQTLYDAKFALPWCAAARLVHGRLDVRTFVSGDLADPEVLALADRIVAEPWAGAPASSPFAGAAEVTVAGATRSARLESPRGSAQAPLSREEVETKFRANAGLLIAEEAMDAVISAVDGLGPGAPLAALADAIVAVPTVSTV